MTAVQLIQRINSLGGQLTILDDHVQVRAPKGALTDQLKGELKRLKSQLLNSETWEFRKLKIPSQTKEGYLDVWMCGHRTDGVEAFRLWFVGQEEAAK